jgi:arylsulfatase
VLIYADDLGYGDLCCYGARGGHTPNLDRMAREGVRFTDFYVAQAVCSASRATLLTGCYPQRVGILGALGPNSRAGLGGRDQTIADVLKTRGYATAIYGPTVTTLREKCARGCNKPGVKSAPATGGR